MTWQHQGLHCMSMTLNLSLIHKTRCSIFACFFAFMFCTLSFNLNSYEKPFSLPSNTEIVTYLLWDNHTPATREDLLADPLLVLRTSKRYSDPNHKLLDAYQRIAELNAFSKKSFLCHTKPSDYRLVEPEEITIASTHLPLCRVTNQNGDFYLCKPSFELDAIGGTCEKLWWQISSLPDFSNVISSFDNICTFKRTLTLSDLEATFLDNTRVYYFQVRGGNADAWGPWSEPFTFTIVKPEPVHNLHIETDSQIFYNIAWEANDSEDTTYLIFGSNSIDFIPNIYSSEQLETIIEHKIVTTSTENNFLAETKASHFPINQRFAFYRVIAKREGSFSRPSQLLPICDGLPAPECNVMQCDINHPTSLFREKIPEGYQWMQKRTYSDKTPSTHYVKNPYVSEEVWNMLSPYFLPDHFPEKAALDRIFSKRRVLSSTKSMAKSGFILITNPKDKIIVAKHPHLKGYLIKAYTDKMDAPDWYWWKKRIDGICAIQEKITQCGYQAIMKTPKKWIYPLPIEPSPKEETPHRKNFILVVEQMDIFNQKRNLHAYKTKMTTQILDALYIILMDLSLIDSVYADNTPFCKDGKLAFIDSEHSKDTTQPVPITTVANYLSPSMYAYWEQLFVNGGPKR